MGKTQWDRIRKQVYEDYNHKCGICGRDGRLEAHEIWEYDDTDFVQRLAGLIALCPLCHLVKHLGLPNTRGRDGKGYKWVNTDEYYCLDSGVTFYGKDDGSVVQIRSSPDEPGGTQILEIDEDLIQHFMDVNECSREEFEQHHSQALERYTKRSLNKNWRVDWGPYQYLVEESGAKKA